MRRLTDKMLKETQAAYKKAGGVAVKAAKMLGLPVTTLKTRLEDMRKKGIGNGLAKRRANGVTREAFLAQHDSTTRIRDAIKDGIKRLEEGVVVKDTEFRQAVCGVPGSFMWRGVAREKDFRKHQFECDLKTWWGTPATVKWILANVTKARPLSE